MSLFSDHSCTQNDFGLEIIHELKDHTGEIWHLDYSHDGKRLASCGSDGKVVIWNLETNRPVHQLMSDEDLLPGSVAGITRAAWSYDDKFLVMCSYDGRATLWNTEASHEVALK